jgi:hypothetical protein
VLARVLACVRACVPGKQLRASPYAWADHHLYPQRFDNSGKGGGRAEEASFQAAFDGDD